MTTSMIISTTGSTTAISSRSALVATAMIPAGPTMAGNGSTFAATTATTKSKSLRVTEKLNSLSSTIDGPDHFSTFGRVKWPRTERWLFLLV